MYCRKCGTQNNDNTYKCIQCGEVLQQGSGGGAPGGAVNIPNYLVGAILSTLFCCLPLGIPAIVFASQVNSKSAAGDIAGALEASRKAKLFVWLSFGLGLAGGLIYAFFLILAAAAGAGAE